MRLGSHGKIGICWAFVIAGGIYSFYLSKKSVIDRRYEDMKRRERIKASNSENIEKIN